jgi:diguanylate cyclase (GGDEF)-like protein/PAS domain S-box-containing protein
MSNTSKFRTLPEARDTEGRALAGDRIPTGATTVVRVDPNTFVGEDGPELHPHLRTQLRELRLRSGSPVIDVGALLRLVSAHYQAVDEERRGIVQSMRLMADEARAMAHEVRTQSSEHLQVILDHIKDVVLTVDEEGVIRTFNPTGERVFGFGEAEVVGERIDLLIPKIAQHETVPQALQRLAASSGDTHMDLAARESWGLRKDGRAFPLELAVSNARASRREMYVVCLRDVTDRRESEQAVRESEARYRLLVDHAPEAIVVLDADAGTYIDANENAERLFGLDREQLLRVGPAELSPPLQPDGANSRDIVRAQVERALDAGPLTFEWLHRDAFGKEFMCDVRLVRLPSGSRRLVRGSITDISERKRQEGSASAEHAVFEKLSGNAPLPAVLESITRLIESEGIGTMCSVSVLAPEGVAFQYAVAPRLPDALRSALSTAVVDIRNGSCTAAVYLGRQVLVHDIAKDPFWEQKRQVALDARLRSAWSTPIKASTGKVLGSLGVFRSEVGLPTANEQETMAHAAQLAGIAIERRLSEEALRDSEKKFRGLFETIAEGVYQSRRDGRFMSVNPAFVEMFGYSSTDEIYALPTPETLYWNPMDRVEFTRRLELEGDIRNFEFLARHRSGKQLVILENARAIRDALGRLLGYEGTLNDITERKRAEQAVFAEKERAEVTLQSIGDAVISTNAEGLIDYMNPVAENLTGWNADEAHGRAIGDVLNLVSEQRHEPLENPLLRALGRGEGRPEVSSTDHSVLVTRSGQEIAIQESAAPICDRQGRMIGAVIVFHDVTKERRLKRALAYQASHDALTGLINRREFDNRLQSAVQRAQKGEEQHALLYIDLDQFKVVNDTCGHQAGDRLLRDVTGLLQTRIRSSDTIARLGGDEFGVLLEGCTMDQATRIAESARQSIRDYRFVWGATALSVGASIGVVEIRRETENVAAVMSAADIACYAAKDGGRNRIHVYDSGGVSSRHREMHWVARVTRAAEENRLELFFQPISAIGSQSPPRFHELTVKLRGDDGQLVPPSEFIPAAERYNAMSIIDRWVVQQAVGLLKDKQLRGVPLPMLAINVSGTSLNEQTFVDLALASLADPVIAGAVCFEITETAAVTNLADAIHFMRELKTRGCKFALDDFGTGLSSFMYLRTLPVDYLKIDGQFIAQIASDPVDRSMVEAISKVGRALGIATIAECVETAVVLEELKRLGVDFAQGYYIARPAPIAQLN